MGSPEAATAAISDANAQARSDLPFSDTADFDATTQAVPHGLSSPRRRRHGNAAAAAEHTNPARANPKSCSHTDAI